MEEEKKKARGEQIKKNPGSAKDMKRNEMYSSEKQQFEKWKEEKGLE